jgi:hypothetical protein
MSSVILQPIVPVRKDTAPHLFLAAEGERVEWSTYYARRVARGEARIITPKAPPGHAVSAAAPDPHGKSGKPDKG